MPDMDDRRPEPGTLLNDDDTDCEAEGAKPCPPADLGPGIDICCASGEGDEELKETLGRG